MYSNEEENDKYNDNGVLSQFLLCQKNEQFSYEEYSSEEKNINKIEKFFLNNDKEKTTINITNNKNLSNENLNNHLNKKEKETSKISQGNKIRKVKKKSGRKKIKLNDNNKIEHNKYSDDNLRRKIKYLVLKYVMKFLNERIKIIYDGNIRKGIYEKQLKIINQKQIREDTVNFNKQFLKSKIKDIFSTNITKKYTYFPVSHNKELINELLNERDENKREYFNKLFNLEFIECLKNFRGEQYIDILKGLKSFNDIKDEIIEKYEEDGNEYYKTIEYYINNYEKIILSKTPRRSRKNNN